MILSCLVKLSTTEHLKKDGLFAQEFGPVKTTKDYEKYKE